MHINHFMYIPKVLTDLCFPKSKNKNKKSFSKSSLQLFSSENVLIENNEVCLSINDAKSIKLEKGTIEFKNLFKQLLAPKIYSDFECILKC